MTEVQRIVKMGGVIPEKFLQPETICDFYVDEKRKKVWAIGVDLLVKLDAVCRAHNLRYSLAYGSLLGCIRHQGFIPWDDDIDVVMPRKDYEELRRLKNEFDNPYYLQYPSEDEGYFFSFAKLRNSNTTAISWPFRYESFNQGMFLDIFPLDNYNSSNIEENIGIIKKLVAECSALMRRSVPNPEEEDIKKISQFPVIRKGEVIVKELDNILRQYNDKPCDNYIVWCNLAYNYKRMIFPKLLQDDLIEVEYYGHIVFIPRYYNALLKITYGDYMKLPPIEERGTWHSKSVFEPDIPYKESLRRIRGEI